MGETICKVIRYEFILFKCPKCLTFWSVLCYLLCCHIDIISCIGYSFISAYIALWIDLLLALISEWYEKIYESVGTEEPKDKFGSEENKTDKE